MNKRKNDQWISNRTIQMLIIFAIIAIVFSQLNVWAVWWIPFLIMGGGCSGWAYHHDEKQKRKNDEYDGEYV